MRVAFVAGLAPAKHGLERPAARLLGAHEQMGWGRKKDEMHGLGFLRSIWISWISWISSGQARSNVVEMISMSGTTETSEAAILSRVIRPDNGAWSKEAAQSVLQFDFPSADVERMNALAAKAREGSLSGSEEAELGHYRDVGRLLELLQSKARLSLERLSSSS